MVHTNSNIKKDLKIIQLLESLEDKTKMKTRKEREINVKYREILKLYPENTWKAVASPTGSYQ